MAAASKETQYRRQGAVMGSLAHDLTWEDPEHQLRHAGARPSFTVERTGTKVREKVQPKVQTVVDVCQAHPVSAISVLGFVAVAVLAVMTILCYVQLTVLSAEVVELSATLSTLQSEGVTLQADYAKIFDTGTVKAAAMAGGMTEPSSSQVYYMDLSGGDAATVYEVAEQPTSWEQTSQSLSHQMERLVEYFR